LLDVSIPTLMLSLVHMSGDPSLIRGELKPAGLFLNEVQGYMSEEDKAAARKIALEVIADYRDRGCPEPEPIGPELLQEMMQWLVCEPVPPEYVPMLLEEMELDGKDSRAVRGTPADDFPVIVIGCGESGLLAGIRLKVAGIPFTIVEKNAGVGGTWWQNTTPVPATMSEITSIATASSRPPVVCAAASWCRSSTVNGFSPLPTSMIGHA
jgi:4-hydroxyacetophenone monooxygenase